jgi:Glutamine amidotransferase domain
MCGIAGFTFARGLPPEERRARWGERLRSMIGAVGHRGPDARRGVVLDGVALGHARLAIVDVEGGQQPMLDPATGVTLVFNGEIFNHVELRARLAPRYPFRTRSDTEVLLAAWLDRGPACLDEVRDQVRDLVPLVARLCRFQGDIVWDTTKPNGQPRRMLDTSRALKEFGWKARIGFEEGLRETVEWYEANRG